tara:strand:- start:75 stop:458 length:384 start_codon:yes stop_codon:yes gene_type:complete
MKASRSTTGLKDKGVRDFEKDLPIDAFYDIKNIRHLERQRGAYEIGWRWARAKSRSHLLNTTKEIEVGSIVNIQMPTIIHGMLSAFAGQTVAARVYKVNRTTYALEYSTDAAYQRCRMDKNSGKISS